MSEVIEAVESQPAPELPATAAEVPVVEAQPEEKPVEQPAKTFTQEELDAAIGKRLAREQRKWEREQSQMAQEAQQHSAQRHGDLKPEQFETVEQYAEALAERKANEKLAAQEERRHQNEVLATYHEKEEEARSKYDDFEQVAYNPRLAISDVMAQSIQASDIGPDVAYFLGSNPQEADRISRLAPLLQAKEIGRLEAKLAAEPPTAKQVSKAPAPISPVTPTGSGVPAYDLDDPRSYKQLGPDAWLAARREKALKEARAGRT